MQGTFSAMGGPRPRRRRLFLTACVGSWIIGHGSAFAMQCGDDTLSNFDSFYFKPEMINGSSNHFWFVDLVGVTSGKLGVEMVDGLGGTDTTYSVNKATFDKILMAVCQSIVPRTYANAQSGYTYVVIATNAGHSNHMGLANKNVIDAIDTIARASLQPTPGATP
jgi:hypothetical protein